MSTAVKKQGSKNRASKVASRPPANAKKLLPLQLRSIYITKSASNIEPWFDASLPNQNLTSEFRILGQQILVQEATLQSSSQEVPDSKVRSCKFVTMFEFRYKLSVDEDVLESARKKLAIPIESFSDDKVRLPIVATLSADITVDYLRLTEENIPEDDLSNWGHNVAVIQAWPYWREHCQSLLAKMNLPIQVMPLYVSSQE